MSSMLIFGCTKETTEGGDSESETGGDGGGGGGLCELESPYICECEYDGEWITLEQWLYSENPTAGDNACYLACYARYEHLVDAWKITPVACIEYAPVIDCSSWNPGLAISHGDAWDHFHVDRGLIEALTRDPDPLRSCDDAVLVRNINTGGYVVMDSNPGEMLFELGLRNGDTLQSLNGHALNTPEDVIIAYTDLWSNGESDFVLDLQRDRVRTQLHYTLVE